MDNKILDDIKMYAIKRLNAAYGYCGAAEGDSMAMLTTSDADGNDIKIMITSKSQSD